MARTFNGTTQWLTRSSAVIAANPFSMFAWFKTTTAGSQAALSQTIAGSNGAYDVLRVGSAVAMEQFDGTANPIATAGAALNDGAWHAAGGVVTSTTSRKAYADGVAGTLETTSCAATAISTTDTTSIGVLIRPANAYFMNGTLAEVALWSVALTDADMAALALGLSPLFVRPDALVAYWPLLGAYAPEIELFGHNDLTVTGATAAAHVRVFLKTRYQRPPFSKVAATFAAAGTLTFTPSATFALHASLAAGGTLTFSAAANLTVGAARFAANGTLTFTLLGDLAAGVRPTTILVWIAGRQAHLREGSLSILDTLNAAPNTAQAVIDTTAPVGGQPVVIGVGTLGDPVRLIFAGEVQTVDQTYVGTPLSPLWPTTLIDYTFALNRRRPFGTFVAVSATTIAQTLISTYAPGFTSTHVQAALPAVSIIFDGSQDFGTCLQALATAIGGYYGGPDYTKDIWLFLTDASATPDPIDVAHPILSDSPMTVSTDLSQIRTRVFGKGHGETVPCDVLAAETIVPIANSVMFNAAGGHALAGTTAAGAQSQIIGYTGTQLGGGGSLVGPGAAPSAAPGLALVAGAGLGTGIYQYAYTDVTAAGESLPGPLGSITTGVLPPPGAITAGYSTAGGSIDYGQFDYVVTFVTAGGETTPSAISARIGTSGDLGYFTIPLSNIPIGLTGVTSRKIYRRFNGTGTFKLLTTIANNTATTYSDQLPNSSLGADAPSSNTATAQQVSVSGIAIGPAAVTQRKVYRTAVGGSQLKLLTTIANNTATTFADSTADGSLGANVPTGDTSGLTQPTGQVVAGSTSLLLAGAGAFATGGGWALIGSAGIRYTGITGNTLTGIPATGPGALLTSVTYGTQVLPAPALTGVTGLTLAMLAGTPVSIWVQRDDVSAQIALAALEGGDGIHEFLLDDGRRGETSLAALCDANLALYSRALVTVTYQTRDLKTKSGKPVHIDLPATAALAAILGDFTIQQAAIVIDGPLLLPRFTVTASSVRFSLDDLLRRALLVAA